MPVFKYRAVINKAEAVEDGGAVIASDKDRARDKLMAFGLTHIHLKRLHGWKALLTRFQADVR